MTAVSTKEGSGLGGVGGAIAGFALGGPVGALVGAAVGAGLGFGISDFVMKKKLVIPPAAASLHSPPPPAQVTTLLGTKDNVRPMSPQPPSAPVDSSIQQMAAVAMNAALGAHGYKKADMPLYMAFQRAAGLTVDGLPGTNTMNKLATVLVGAGVNMANVKDYPWHSTGAYDGVNAPTAQDWNGWSDNQAATFTQSLAAAVPAVIAAAPPIAIVDSVGMPTASQVAAVLPVLMGTPVVSNQDVQRALNQLGYANPLLVADGIIGPKSIVAVKAFQSAKGLTVDGIPGPITKGALQAALAGG